MAINDKKKLLKDVLGELDKKKEPNTSVTNSFSSEDITGLEKKIPVVNDGIINFSDDPELDNIEIPLPDDISFSYEDKDPKPIKRSFSEPEQKPSSKKIDANSINNIEALQQKLSFLELENKKQADLINKQKKELEEYMTRLGEAESDNRKIKAELSNFDVNAKLNLEAQLNRATIIEEKYNKLAQKHEEMKLKIRQDIRKIRFREKELANKLEITRSDSETLLNAKDQKILQLKQNIDELEFEIETLKEKLVTLQEQSKESEEKAERVIKALRLSTSLLEVNPKK
jgi:DNA repair exonuclease SbcCD ATPase subunit